MAIYTTAGTQNYRFSLAASGNGHMIDFDAAGRFTSGVVRKQTASAFSTAQISGNYAFGVELVRKYLSGPTVEEGPAFKAHYILGQLLEKQGDRSAAAQEYRAALALARNYTRAQEALKRTEY